MDFLSTLTLAAESADKIQETVNATMFNVGDGNGIWYSLCSAVSQWLKQVSPEQRMPATL